MRFFLLYSPDVVTTQLFGLAVSYLFVFGVLGGAGALLRAGVVTPFTSRKLVHIGVAHWWFIAVYFFEDTAFAVIGPLSFIVLNYISYRTHLFAAMEDPEQRKNLGTVYFPVSLLALVLATWSGVLSFTHGAVALMALAYGDGCAALLGGKFGGPGFHAPGGRKTLVGSVAMLIAVFCVSLVFLGQAQSMTRAVVAAALIALVATSTELLTPWGLDNLTIPLATAVVAHLVALV